MGNQAKYIRTIREVAHFAQKMFPCALKLIEDEVHAGGAFGVKLIVGQKPNPAYDPNANPNDPTLTPELKKLMENRANPVAPDVRILWIRPGTTELELIDILHQIKLSLQVKKAIVDKSITTISKNEKSDADLAAEVVAGKSPNLAIEQEETEIGFGFTGKEEKKVEAEDEDFNDEEEDEDEEIEDIDEDNEEEVEEGEKISEEESDDDKGSNKDSQILDALNNLNSNLMTVAGDLKGLSDRVNNLEEGKDIQKRMKKGKKSKK